MTSPDNTYQDTLNKMANLEELSRFIVSQNAALEGNRGSVIKQLNSMQASVGKVRDEIDKITNKGVTATTNIKKVISDAEGKQKQALNNIKAMITDMTKTDKLKTAITALESDINALVIKAGAPGSNTPGSNGAAKPAASKLDPTAKAFVPGQGAAKPAAAAEPTGEEAFRDVPDVKKGGYTYSKKSRKSRRSKGSKSSKKTRKHRSRK